MQQNKFCRPSVAGTDAQKKTGALHSLKRAGGKEGVLLPQANHTVAEVAPMYPA
jgi:hypothetical protein